MSRPSPLLMDRTRVDDLSAAACLAVQGASRAESAGMSQAVSRRFVNLLTLRAPRNRDVPGRVVTRHGLELADVAVDGCHTKAPCGGERAGPSPSGRRKGGLKRSVASDREGIPLGIAAAAGNRHDSPLLRPTLQAASQQLDGMLPAKAATRGPRRTSEIIAADPPGAVLGWMSTSGRSRWNRAISELTSTTLITCIMPSGSVPRRPAWAPTTAAGQEGGDGAGSLGRDVVAAGAAGFVGEALDEHRDLAAHVRLVSHRLHRRAFGDRYRFVVTGDHEVEHSSRSPSAGCAPRQVMLTP
jgi:hypothetical protein